MNEKDLTTRTSPIGAEELITRSQDLLAELEEFKIFLAQRGGHEKDGGSVELRQFRNSIVAESKSLEKLADADLTSDKTIHTLRSSNLPYYEAVWEAAKRSTGLVAFHKRMYWEETSNGPQAINKKRTSNTRKLKRRSVLVDIVAKGGSEWVKVSTITETRLLFEIAKAEWENLSDSEDDGEEADADSESSHSGLVKLAEDLSLASRATRVRYKHPQVRFVLPNIALGHVPEIDAHVAKIQATGAEVEYASPSSNTSISITFKDIADKLLVNPFYSFSSTLNIDCTILLALVSDLSHGAVEMEPRFHRAIIRQIELEKQEKLLPELLLPAMSSRRLVCTHEAHKRMREIVDLIGTETERKRTALLMGDDPEKTQEILIREFQELSEYQITRDWNLPITIVESDVGKHPLPHSAHIVSENLSQINQSVFLYGWATGQTTISSNRTVANLIETLVEEHRESDEEKGPDIWLCPTARSLVGKEKNRKA